VPATVTDPHTTATTGRLSLITVQQDGRSADLAVTGRLDTEAAAILSIAVDGRLRGGRRYLRLNLGAVSAVDRPALAPLAVLHRRLLAARGRLILTGLGARLERQLSTERPGLLLLVRTAADHTR
jgi:anti-anti-sigma regulatory factor